MTLPSIVTPRLELIPATPELLRLELSDRDAFAAALAVRVAAGWPPGEYDADAMRFFLDQMTTQGDRVAGWLGYYVVARDATSPRELIGAAGYFGPPDGGAVEIGFSIVETWRRRGIATEVAAGLIEHAARQPTVRRVVARSRRDNLPSHGVLLKCGFHPIPSDDADLAHFERVVGSPVAG